MHIPLDQHDGVWNGSVKWNLGSLKEKFSFSRTLALVICGLLLSSPLVNIQFSEAEPVTVVVTITRVIEIVCADDFIVGIPPCPSDFYAKVQFGDDSFIRSSTVGIGCTFCGVIGDWEIEPFWTFSTTVERSMVSLPITIALYDEDDLSSDDNVDIDPRDGSTWLGLELDLNTGTWSGETSLPFSSGPADDFDGSGSATIFFDISTSGSGDADGDGLLDGWEIFGYHSDTDGIVDVDLPAFGANPMHKDLFLELDWMTGEEPKQVEIQAVKDAFARAPADAGGTSNPDGLPGINLWIDTGSLLDSEGTEDGIGTCNDGIDNNFNGKIDLADPNCLFEGDAEGGSPTCNDGIDNGGDGLTDFADPSCLVGDNLGGGNTMAASPTNRTNDEFYDLKGTHFNRHDRGGIFRYALSAQPCTGCPGGSGERGGNDIVLYRTDAPALMHELGHNLNLWHGGNEDNNCKPNYVSVMNYDHAGGILQVGGSKIIDYSPPRVGNARGIAPLEPLDEKNLSEGTILDNSDNVNQFVFVNANGGKVRSALNLGIDWNGNGVVEPTLSDLDVNIDTVGQNGEPKKCLNDDLDTHMSGHDDWSRISLPFRHFGDSADAPINLDTTPDPTEQEVLELEEELNTTDLELTKVESKDPAVAGEELVYTIKVVNNGPNPADAVLVTDILPEGVAYVSGTTGCLEDPKGTITCLLGSLPAGESVTVSITVLVDADLVYLAGSPVTITNDASVENLAGPDSDTSNNAASAETEVIAVTDVEITSFLPSSPAEAVIGKSFEVVLTKNVVNNGPSSPVDVDVDVTASATSGVTIDPTSASSSITALATGDNATVAETFTAECIAPGFQGFEFSNTVEPINADDPDPDDNKAELEVEVECLIPVQINISPGGYPNSVNLKSKTGVIAVAVLSTAAGEYGLPIAIDATMIDPLSVHLGPADLLLGVDPPGGATEYHNIGHILNSVEMDEKTRDRDSDMILHFYAKQTGLVSGDTEACLNGQILVEGTWYTFFGCDSIKT